MQDYLQKKKAKRKLESQKNTVRGAADIKHIRYCHKFMPIKKNSQEITYQNDSAEIIH